MVRTALAVVSVALFSACTRNPPATPSPETSTASAKPPWTSSPVVQAATQPTPRQMAEYIADLQRFQLIKTENYWTAWLLDRATGRVWQCFIKPPDSKNAATGCIAINLNNLTKDPFLPSAIQ
jgi:hypothetical protein